MNTLNFADIIIIVVVDYDLGFLDDAADTRRRVDELSAPDEMAISA